jgi:hypothetical protein
VVLDRPCWKLEVSTHLVIDDTKLSRTILPKSSKVSSGLLLMLLLC